VPHDFFGTPFQAAGWMYLDTTEETDREAQAHMAIVFLAPTEKYFAALGPHSLSHTEPHHPTVKEKS